jgi:hypothetical protein
MQSALLSLFSQVSDPRRGRGKMYSPAPILLFTVLAMLAGAVSYRQNILGHLAIAEKSNELPAAQDMITTSGSVWTPVHPRRHARPKDFRHGPGHGNHLPDSLTPLVKNPSAVSSHRPLVPI